MPLNSKELLEAAEMVAECKQMKVTVKNSMLGAGTTALTTFLGGILGGPIGLFIGATGGGLVSYKLTKDQFKPLTQVIREDLTPAQRNKLVQHLSDAIKDFDITDVMQLVLAIQTQDALLMIIYSTVKNFVESDCKLAVA